eukprot:2836661-Pyramimonas_sp.AAC.1
MTNSRLECIVQPTRGMPIHAAAICRAAHARWACTPATSPQATARSAAGAPAAFARPRRSRGTSGR